ncbi:uncharacterized protein BJ212DRAFT_1581118 [Suillus subaureus]|uniref:Chromatin elongation factor spt5 n=1 Tax=Suillus subaureus TaxID=48587 RepID=A0A9P7DVI9_9AGAM|nr:uncharacterized protein BJ212DRAFT_1581118 [Suillus subaureus]KAG1803962.1 hypothetical protein BJ212DRAFT_1581118 [Suillus subaureus]
MGLLLKNFCCDSLELVASPHTNDIQLHLQSGWDVPFFKKTLKIFSLQFLCIGDSARSITGEVCQEICTVISTNHASGSTCLKFLLNGHGQELEFQLQDIERVFWIGNTVRVVVGAYTGLEGHIIKKSEDLFHMCQEATNEEVELPMQPDFDPLPEPESFQIGDEIEVCVGEYMGKCRIVVWFPVGGTTLWFCAVGNIEDELINAPTAFVQHIRPFKTLQFTKERRYDVKPGDIMTVTHGPEFQTKGVVQAVDFSNVHLTLISEGDYSLVNVPIGFAMKISNMNPDSFCDIIGKEVFIIRGAWKGYQAMLYQLAHDTCSISVHGQAHTMVKCEDVATSAILKVKARPPPPDPIVPSSSSMDPSSSKWSNWSSNDLTDSLSAGVKTYNPWVANNAEDIKDTIADIKEKSRNSKLRWARLMGAWFYRKGASQCHLGTAYWPICLMRLDLSLSLIPIMLDPLASSLSFSSDRLDFNKACGENPSLLIKASFFESGMNVPTHVYAFLFMQPVTSTCPSGERAAESSESFSCWRGVLREQASEQRERELEHKEHKVLTSQFQLELRCVRLMGAWFYRKGASQCHLGAAYWPVCLMRLDLSRSLVPIMSDPSASSLSFSLDHSDFNTPPRAHARPIDVIVHGAVGELKGAIFHILVIAEYGGGEAWWFIEFAKE